MSTLETILTRAMSDAAFADQLFADSAKALAGYNLTAEEMTALNSMSRADLGKISSTSLEERKSLTIVSNILAKKSDTARGATNNLK